MHRQKLLPKQQDMFSGDVEKMQWENLKPNEQQQIIELFSQILLSLSSHLVTYGGTQDAIENND